MPTSELQVVNVGNDFDTWLLNRDQNQTDGQHNAVEFRNKYLRFLDNDAAWRTDDSRIKFDLRNVEFIGSSFANEAFAFFRQYTTADKIKKVILFEFKTSVQRRTVYEEIESGYSRS